MSANRGVKKVNIKRKFTVKSKESEEEKIKLIISDFHKSINERGVEGEEKYDLEFKFSETEGRNIDDVFQEIEQEIELIKHYNIKKIVNKSVLVMKYFDSFYQINSEFSNDGVKACRYCGESDAKYFKTKAHSIPEALGNKNLFNLYECDKCNNKFGSGIEHDFIKYLAPMLFSGGILGKKSQKEIRESDDNIKSFSYKKVENGIEMIFKDNLENPSTEINEEKKYMIIKISRLPYIPYNVFLGFCKIVYNLLPKNKVQDYKYLKDLINGDKIFRNSIVIKENFYEKKNSTYSPTDFISYASLVEFRERSEDVLILILKLRYYIYEIIIPKTDNTNLSLLKSKTTILKELKKGTTYINLSNKDRIENDFKELCLGFEKIEFSSKEAKVRMQEKINSELKLEIEDFLN